MQRIDRFGELVHALVRGGDVQDSAGRSESS